MSASACMSTLIASFVVDVVLVLARFGRGDIVVVVVGGSTQLATRDHYAGIRFTSHTSG